MRDNNSHLIIHDGADYDLDVDFAPTFNYYALWERNKYKLKIEASENYTPSIADPYVREADLYYNQKLSDIGLFHDKTRSGHKFAGKFTKKKIAETIDRKYYSGEEGTDYVTKGIYYRDLKDLTVHPLWLNSGTP